MNKLFIQIINNMISADFNSQHLFVNYKKHYKNNNTL